MTEREQRASRAGRGRAAELIKRAGRAGADDALSQLINQFSDPLSFLRELVQNSLDAASTRIDVDFTFEAGAPEDAEPEAKGKRKNKRKGKRKKKPRPQGLMTITVTDNGEGMNEGIIDNYLLTLFRSTKEQDLTKIGKFGVGFVSIFALQPQLVVLETGQAGESWRVLFHADASYEKLQLDEPLEGTRVALHKRVSRSEYDKLRARGRKTVRYWCKYAEAEICVNGEPIGEPFDLPSPLKVTYQEPGTELVVGFAPPAAASDADLTLAHQGTTPDLCPLVGFYNRGLTLVEAAIFPPPDEAGLAGLSVRIKSRYLEHTLTRDNVLQDEHYAKALGLVRTQVERSLRAALVQRLERLAARPLEQADDGPPLWLCLHYARLPAMRLHETAPRAQIYPICGGGAPLSHKALSGLDPVLCAPQDNPVTQMLAADKIPALLDQQGLVAHLQDLGLSVSPADERYYTAVLPADETTDHGPLLARVLKLLDAAKARVKRVVLGDLSYPGSPRSSALFVRQAEAFGLTRVDRDDRPTLLGGAREIVLNTAHGLTRRCLTLSATDAALAALLLAAGICLLEGLDRGRTVRLAETTAGWAREDQGGVA